MIVIGVDVHKHELTAVAVDELGHAPARAAYEAAGFTLVPIARYFRMLR